MRPLQNLRPFVTHSPLDRNLSLREWGIAKNAKGTEMRINTINSLSLTDEVPADVRDWVNSSELIRWILEIQHTEVRTISGPTLAPSARLQMLLTLLTYCYATGTLATEEIERKIENDATVRYLCARTYPDGATLRQFRRYHRERIKATLSQLLRRAWRHTHRKGEKEASGSPGADRCRWPAEFWPGSSRARTELDFDHEAERRIVEATQLDCMALDD